MVATTSSISTGVPCSSLHHRLHHRPRASAPARRTPPPTLILVPRRPGHARLSRPQALARRTRQLPLTIKWGTLRERPVLSTYRRWRGKLAHESSRIFRTNVQPRSIRLRSGVARGSAPCWGRGGVPRHSFLPPRAACGARKRSKKDFRGDTPHPGRGLGPLHSLFGIFVSKIRDDS